MIRILVICTGNSARSQIAEGLFRHLAGNDVEVASAGTHPTGYVHPLAISTMKERGIDISSQTSKPLAQFEGKPFDIVITVCDDAYQKCPVFPGVKQQLHWNTPDPGLVIGTKEEQREAFRATIVSLEQKILELASQIHET